MSDVAAATRFPSGTAATATATAAPRLLSSSLTTNGNMKKGGPSSTTAATASPVHPNPPQHNTNAQPSTAAAHILALGQLDVDRRLDFITTNRVVAVLEKAVERLQLLTLLDATTGAALVANVGGNAEKSSRAGMNEEEELAAAGGGSKSKRGKEGGGMGDTMSKTQKILAHFAVDTHSPATAAAAAQSNAIVQEALAASTATSRPAATFVTFDGNTLNNSNSTRRTAAQVTQALAEASTVSRRGRPSVGEMLAEQQRLETRYGELLRAAQQLHKNRFKINGDNNGNNLNNDYSGGEGSSGETKTQRQPHEEQSFAQLQLSVKSRQDPERAAIARELKLISQRLRNHNKHLCTQLKDNPNDADNWRKIANERAELVLLLRDTIGELTQGYAAARRNQYAGSGTLDGSFRNGNLSLTGAGTALKRTDSKGSLLSGTGMDGGGNNISGGGMGDSSFSHRASQQSEVIETTSVSMQSSSQQQQQHAASRRFGSMAQMRRTPKPSTNHPRIPLSSSYAQFARKIMQEAAAQRWADDLVRKERELNQNVKQLQSDLQSERAKKEKELAERQQRINQLRVQLRELKRELKQRSDAAKEKAEAAGEGLQRRAREEESGIQDACDDLQRQLTVEQRTHALFTQHLRERTDRMDVLATEWQRKNPTEIKRTELQKMDAEQSKQQCAERLVACEEEVARQQTLKTERDTTRAAEEAETLAAEQQRQAVYVSTSVLQSAVRAMLTREAVGKLKKKNARRRRKRSTSANPPPGRK